MSNAFRDSLKTGASVENYHHHILKIHLYINQ